VRRVGFRHPSVIIGEPAQDRSFTGPDLEPHIHPSATLEALVQVDAGTGRPTWIGPDVWLMKGVHVGHDVMIMDDCELPPGCVVCGWVTLEPGVRCGVGVLIRPYIRIGMDARLGAGAVVVKDVPPGEVWVGNPARKLR
jgi:acyl-[acyl carrier protein]--UDP-N-acetylglucosamine O-acyltransferase